MKAFDHPLHKDSSHGKLFTIENAGAALLTPFLPRLFSMIDLTKEDKFADAEARLKAVFLIHYAIFGNTKFSGPELIFNRLLTGFAGEISLPADYELTENEKGNVNDMLAGITQHWNSLSNTTVAGLQVSFLQRKGKLEEFKDTWLLTVETQSFDMLLDRLPWSFSTIKYPWMEKAIEVSWQ